MTRLTAFAAASTLLAATSALPALAQNFNAAPPHGQGQQPAFDGQTRAPVLPAEPALSVQVVVDGLDHPWGMVHLPDGGWLVTEKSGNLRLVGPDGTLSQPIAGLPPIDSRGQGGLLDVAIDADFARTRQVWFSFAEPRGNGRNATAVGTGTLSDDGTALRDVRTIWQQTPAWRSTKHFGSRLVFDGRGGLFVTTGERSDPEPRVYAQNVTATLGKVVRINPADGAPLGDPGVPEALPEIWSWGHRNIQGATMGPDGALWTIEHGPMGGDELNRPQAGRNYGWPKVTYGLDYSGAPIGDGITRLEGTEQPVYYWDPVIAPGGMTFYDGPMFPDWRGDLLISGLKARALVRLEMADGRVTGEARYPLGQGRIRDVEVAPDGAIWLLTDEDDGRMLRLTPQD